MLLVEDTACRRSVPAWGWYPQYTHAPNLALRGVVRCTTCRGTRYDNLAVLKIWGYDACVKKLQPNKLESKSDKCVFVGYPKETIGYSFYNKTEGKVFVAKNGVFLEKEFLAKGLSGRTIELDEVNGTEQDEQSSAAPEVVPEVATAPEAPAPPSVEVPVIETSIEPRRSGRIRNQIQRFEDEVLLLENDEPTT